MDKISDNSHKKLFISMQYLPRLFPMVQKNQTNMTNSLKSIYFLSFLHKALKALFINLFSPTLKKAIVLEMLTNL